MEKEFVPYELALKLKALGFDSLKKEPCLAYYNESNSNHDLETTDWWCLPQNDFQYALSAPTFSQAFRWFRDTHNLIHEIQIDRTSQPKFCYAILQYEHYGNYEEIRIREWYLYRTYEEAELACLENLIEVVESKSQQDDN